MRMTKKLATCSHYRTHFVKFENHEQVGWTKMLTKCFLLKALHDKTKSYLRGKSKIKFNYCNKNILLKTHNLESVPCTIFNITKKITNLIFSNKKNVYHCATVTTGQLNVIIFDANIQRMKLFAID